MNVGVIGFGLIGGSLALALKKRCGFSVTAYGRSDEVLKKAKSEGIIDSYTTKIDESFTDCEIIFICTPVSKIAGIGEQLKWFVNNDTIVTDVGSTKKSIQQQMNKYRDNFTFIGGHPMAGSEQSGFGAAKEYLFENAYYLLTPYEYTKQCSIDKLSEVITKTGAIPLVLDAEVHDKTVGAISHVPHIIAMTLVNAVEIACKDNENAKALASGGFKDITRIASSNPAMWCDISLDNRENVTRILGVFKEILASFENDLVNNQSENIYEWFENAKTYRDEFSAIKKPSHMHIIKADVEDKPGVISLVATAFAFNNINIKNIGIANNREYEDGILEIIVANEEDKNKGKAILRANGFVVY